MSAFIVDKAHIDALIQAGLTFGRRYHDALRWRPQRHTRQLDPLTCDEVGKMLWQENVRSIRHRYPDVGPDLENAPGPLNLTALAVNGYTFPLMATPTPQPIAVLKAIACYEYQSCEHPEWETSEAKSFCDALRAAAIRALPGYDDAAWEITLPTPQ